MATYPKVVLHYPTSKGRLEVVRRAPRERVLIVRYAGGEEVGLFNSDDVAAVVATLLDRDRASRS